MDVYEAILSTAFNTLDNVLPPNKEEKGEENGTPPTKEAVGEEEKHKRGIILAQRTLYMFSTAFRRVFGKCQSQMETAVNATDLVVKQVRNAVVRPRLSLARPFYTVAIWQLQFSVRVSQHDKVKMTDIHVNVNLNIIAVCNKKCAKIIQRTEN